MKPDIARRDFLKLAGGAAAACGLSRNAFATGEGRVCVILDPENLVASREPVKKAAERLRLELEKKGVSCAVVDTAEASVGASICVVAAVPESQLARGFSRGTPLAAPESLRLSPGKVGSVTGVLVSAGDARGYVYGLLELAERVRFSSQP